MVWLKPCVLIAARFTFYPSRVSFSFAACCSPIPAALHFLLALWVPAQEQPLLLWSGDRVPAAQAAGPGERRAVRILLQGS